MDLLGSRLRDVARVDVGEVRSVLLDPASMRARWMEVTLDETGETVLVPAEAITQFADGELLVPYRAELMARATHSPGAPLAADDARRLRAHYGFAD